MDQHIRPHAPRLSRRRLVGGAVAAGSLAASGKIHAVSATPLKSQLPAVHIQGATQEVQYYVWGGQELADIIQQQIDVFSEQNPDIKVTPNLYGTAPGQTEEALLTKIAGGVQVDLASTHFLRTSFFADRGAAVALDEFSGWEQAIAGIDPALIESYTVDGHVYAGPNYLNPNAPVYNVDLVTKVGLDADEPPTSWEGFLEWAAALTDEGQAQFGTDIGPQMQNKWMPIGSAMTPYIAMLTGQLVHPLGSDSGEPAVDSEAALQTIQLFQEVYRGGYTFPGQAGEGGPSFTNGKVGITWWGPPSAWPGFRADIGDKFEWRPFPGFPVPAAAATGMTPVAQEYGGYVTIVLSDSPVKEAAWKFLAFQMSKEGQQIFANNTLIPVRTDVDMSAPLAQYPQLETVLEQWQKRLAVVDPRSYNTIEDAIYQAWQQIFIDNQPAEQALAAAAQTMEQAWASGAP